MAASLPVQWVPTQAVWRRGKPFVGSSETSPSGRFPKALGISAPSCLLSVFLQISLVVQRNSDTIKSHCCSLAKAQHSHTRMLCPRTPSVKPHRGKGLCPAPPSCTKVMANAKSFQEMLVEDRLELPTPDAHPRAILAGGTISHSFQMLSCTGKMRVR